MIRNYSFHGVPIRVGSNDRTIVDIFEKIFGIKPVVSRKVHRGLTFTFRVGQKVLPLKPARKTTEHLTLYRKRKILGEFDGENLFLSDKKSFIKISYAGKSVLFHCHPETLRTPKLMSHTLIPLALIELLKDYGFYYIHSSCAEIDGKGILFVGSPASGKSSACYSLVREGAKWVSDDAVLIKKRGKRVMAFAFMKEFSLNSGKGALFKELFGERCVRKIDRSADPLMRKRFCRSTEPKLCFLMNGKEIFVPVRPSEFVGRTIKENEFLFLHKNYARKVVNDLRSLYDQTTVFSFAKTPLILRSTAFKRRIMKLLD